MKLKLYTKTGPSEKEISLSPVFDESLNQRNLAEYINYVRNQMRQPIADALDRGEVSGGGKKPFRQKGTGSARAGSTRSPLWVGGGVTFGPSSDQNFSTRLSKKFRSKARNSVFAQFAQGKRLIIIDSLEVKDGKTKAAEKLLLNLKIEGKISAFFAKEEANIAKSFRNLPYVGIMGANDIDIIWLASSDYLIMTEKAYAEVFLAKKEKNGDK